MIRFGVHCSIRNGLTDALRIAKRIGCESVQIFTRSPRMWKKGFASERDIQEFKSLLITKKIFPLVVHTPYLPNLATSKKRLYQLSIQSMKDDLSFCEKISADYLIIHPGAYSVGSTKTRGIENIARGINMVLSSEKGKTMILLENMAGGGRRIGQTFGELALIMRKIRSKKRIGVCFDTAHAFGAGYDVSSKIGIDKVLKEFDSEIGFKNLKVIHFNDSKAVLASNKDRHEHLGKGFIGVKGFRYLIRRIGHVAEAGILETPKEPPSADRKNLAILFKLRNGVKS